MNRRKGNDARAAIWRPVLLWAAIGYAMACAMLYGFLIVGSL